MTKMLLKSFVFSLISGISLGTVSWVMVDAPTAQAQEWCCNNDSNCADGTFCMPNNCSGNMGECFC